MKFKQKFIEKYVKICIYFFNKLLVPITLFMKHLLTIQNIDTKTVPGAAFRKDLSIIFDHLHNDSDRAVYDKYIQDFKDNAALDLKRFKNNTNIKKKIKLTPPKIRKINLKPPKTKKILIKSDK